MKKNLLVAQSGGPTAVINASLSGVIWKAMQEERSIKSMGHSSGNCRRVFRGICGAEGCAEKQMEEHFPKKEEESILFLLLETFFWKREAQGRRRRIFQTGSDPCGGSWILSSKIKKSSGRSREFQELLSVF